MKKTINIKNEYQSKHERITKHKCISPITNQLVLNRLLHRSVVDAHEIIRYFDKHPVFAMWLLLDHIYILFRAWIYSNKYDIVVAPIRRK